MILFLETYKSYDELRGLMSISEVLAAGVGLIYLPKLYKTIWKWFVFYLLIIATIEIIGKYDFALSKEFVNFVQIPFEFIFFYWLLGYQSLKQKNAFFLTSIIYYVTVIMQYNLIDNPGSRLLNVPYSVGILFLMYFVVQQFKQQIQSDKILEFNRNKMFYINIGLLIGYLGSFPFHAFYNVLVVDHIPLWNFYYMIFLISFTLTYLFFTASFIWGKPN